MKKLLVILVAVFFIALRVDAQKVYCVEVSESGTVTNCENKTITVTVDSMALQFSKRFSDAIAFKGEKLLVRETENEGNRVGLLKKEVNILRELIVYDDNTHHISYVQSEFTFTKYYITYVELLVALILLIVSNLSFWIYSKTGRGKSFTIVAIAACGAIVIFAIGFAVTTLTIAVAALILAVAVVTSVLMTAISNDSIIKYILFLIILCVLTFLLLTCL